ALADELRLLLDTVFDHDPVFEDAHTIVATHDPGRRAVEVLIWFEYGLVNKVLPLESRPAGDADKAGAHTVLDCRVEARLNPVIGPKPQSGLRQGITERRLLRMDHPGGAGRSDHDRGRVLHGYALAL